MKAETRKRLQAAGWRPDRVNPSDLAIRDLEEAGYSIWPTLVSFLRSFGGLSVSIVRNDRPDSFWFDPARAITMTFASWVDEYRRRAEQPLAPLGYAHHDHLLLLLGEDGTWYGGYDDNFGILGHTNDEMLDQLVDGGGFKSV
jgi:hypothetical protein